MKKLIYGISALLLAGGAFAQEKEIDAALKAYESNNAAAAKAELNKVSGQLNSSITISPKSMAKYYYVSGQIALAEGNSIEAAKQFGELAKYENGVIYSVRNKSTKQTEYYATQAEADAAAAKGDYAKPKEETLSPEYLPKIQESVTALAEKTLQAANAAYNSNKNDEAGDKFLEASYLVKALGGNDKLFKYNAALSYHRGEKYQKAFNTYKELIQEGYTGESTSWVAKDKNTGEEVTFNSKSDADTQAKIGLVIGLKEVKNPSIEKELFLNTLKALSGLGTYDAILETISEKYPQDNEIQTVAGNIYHKSGNEGKFLEKLIANTKLDPQNPVNYFNIGVLYMEQDKDTEAIQYFEKAIQVDPNYKNAYTNIALIKVKPEKDYVEIINANLGSSAKEKKTYQEYTLKRKNLYVDIIPYLEKAYEIDKTNLESATMLRKAYQAAEMFDKEDAMRIVEKSLQQ